MTIEETYDEQTTDSSRNATIKTTNIKKETHSTGAQKETRGKSRVDLIPKKALLQLGEIYAMGAEKYAENNWRKGLLFEKHHIGAALRHIFKWESGIDTDEESSLSHLAHATFHLMSVMEQMIDGRVELDDRYKG